MATIRGGRPGDPIRQHFQKLDGSKSKCVDCKENVSNKIERLRAHRKRCPKATPEVSVLTGVKRVAPDIDSDDEDTECLPPPPKRTLQSQMSAYSVKTDSAMATSLDLQIARYFYACNIPFNVAEQSEFKAMISMLRPGYSPPTRKALSGPLLDKVFDSMNTTVASDLDGKDVTLVQDGWSDIHNQPVIASCVHTGSKSYFVEAVDTGANKKTATYCASLAEQAMADTSTKFNCTVRAVVTDNEKKMEVMRRELKENNPDLVVYGCSSHLLNLLGEDLTPKQVTSQVVEVNKYFRNHHRASALLGEQQGSLKPQLIGATRWNSQLRCMETFLKNRPFYSMISAQYDDVVEQRIRNIINNVGVYREAKNLLEQLSPIARALDRLQSDSTSIADACDVWLGLLEEDSLQPHSAKIMKRFTQAMTPEHYLAYALHPKHRGEKLTQEQLESAHELLIRKDPELLPQLCSFQAETAPFLKSMFHDSVVSKLKPSVWWKCVKRTCHGVNSDLSDLALLLLQLPSSSASIERIFSNFGAIQTKLRNRLGLEKAAKLVTCYRALRGSEELDW